MDRIDVGILGATGTVGQRLVRLLADHPWFHVSELAGSPESAGRTYAEGGGPDALDGVDEELGRRTLKDPEGEWQSGLLLSALPSGVAGPIEERLVGRGHLVVSNASSHRMDPDVPLIIPEINPDHLGITERQRERWSGTLITNPNCSVMGLALALAPLHRQFGVKAVQVTTLQSLSGAGRPGPSASEIVDNVLPHITGEEEKLAREPQKILGRFETGRGAVDAANFEVSAHVHRVPVRHGHLLAVSVALEEAAEMTRIEGALEGFTGARLDEALPSAPARPLRLVRDLQRPQPRLDRDRDGGMTVTIGRVRPCQVLDVKFTAVIHNLIRGAAGAALLNAELAHVTGFTSRGGPDDRP